MERRTRFLKTRLDRQHHLPAITEGVEAEELEALRCRPAELGGVQIA